MLRIVCSMVLLTVFLLFPCDTQHLKETHPVIHRIMTVMGSVTGYNGHVFLLILNPNLYFLDELESFEQWASVEVAIGGILPHNPTRDFRYSPSLTQFVVFGIQSNMYDKTWIHSVVETTRLRPEWARLAFVDTRSSLDIFFRSPAAGAIKYKMGVAVDSERLFVHRKWIDADDCVSKIPTEVEINQQNSINIANPGIDPYTSRNMKGEITGGLSLSITMSVCKHFNLTCNHLYTVKGFGRLPNGTWGGYMGDLTAGNLDMMTCLGHNLQKHGYVDFTTSYENYELMFYTPHPLTSIKWVALLYPFSLDLWISVLVVCLVTIPIFYLQSKLKLKPGEEDPKDALYDAVFFPFGTVIQLEARIPRRTELLATVFFFFALIVCTAYNSDLMSYLTWPEPEAMPKTWEELAAMRSEFEIIFHSHPGFDSVAFMNRTENPDLVKIREVMRSEKNRMLCSLAAATEKKTICIQYKLIVQSFMKKNLTIHEAFQPLVASKDPAMSTTICILLRLHSKHYEFWNEKLGYLRDTGNTLKWRADALNSAYIRSIPWMQEQQQNKTKLHTKLNKAFQTAHQAGVKPFNTYNFILAFLVLAGGLLLSFVSVISEIFWNFLKKCLERLRRFF